MFQNFHRNSLSPEFRSLTGNGRKKEEGRRERAEWERADRERADRERAEREEAERKRPRGKVQSG